MLLIGAIFTVPIALLVIVLFLQIKENTDFAAQERIGTAYTGVLRPLFFDLEAYRRAVGTWDAKAIAHRIESDFTAADVHDRGPGAPLELRAQLATFREHWQQRRSPAILLDEMLALLAAVSDNSKITLDPILDGYYVGDTMVDKIPHLIDAIAQADVLGTQILQGGRLGEGGRVTITILSGQLTTDTDGIARNVPIAVAAAPYLAPQLNAATARQRSASRAFLAAVAATVRPAPHRATHPARYAALAHTGLAAAFALYDASIEALDDVLQRRIRTLIMHECLIFAIVLATIAGAVLTMVVTTRSIARRLGAVTNAIRTIVTDDMTQLVEIARTIAKGDQSSRALVPRTTLVDDGSDEAAILAQSYNLLVGRLTDVQADLVTMTTLLSTRAFHDALTGLANRALFMERLHQMFARNARNSEMHAAVVFLDLDRFKLVNDSLGHLAGDSLLVGVARRLEGCMRAGDTLARMGGDEFTFLLENIGSERDVIAFSDRILSELTRPFIIEKREMFASASIGIVFTHGGDEPNAMLRNADIAMYRSKQAGKNRCTLFRPEFLDDAQTSLQLDTDLMAAIERREFVLYYQPIVSLANRELLGFEALVRWQHPERGLLSPDTFIPAAEESGAILAIGAQIIDAAARQARCWRDTLSLSRALPISVNVSARQLSSPRLSAEFKAVLETYRLCPDDLHVEITESAIMDHSDVAVATLHELRALGIAAHLDDFGTGYSSLGYLHQFPVTTLKIDRSFVSMTGDYLGNPQIVATISSLAQALQLETTVEGIETEAQLEQVRALGCTQGQGYLFSRPLTAIAATDFIQNWQPDAIQADRIVLRPNVDTAFAV